MKIAMLLTSQGELGETGKPTGVWLEELAVPYYEFSNAGLDVILTTPEGAPAPIDPLSKETPWISVGGKRFLEDDVAMAGVQAPQAIAKLSASEISAIFLVGGMGAAWDFPHSPPLATLIEALDRRGAAVSGICHGVLGLLGAYGSNGKALVDGRKVTGFTLQEDRLLQLEGLLPILPEPALRAAGALFSSAAEPWAEHVVADGQLFTGQNPVSATSLARAVIRHVKSGPA